MSRSTGLSCDVRRAQRTCVNTEVLDAAIEGRVRRSGPGAVAPEEDHLIAHLVG